MTDGFSDGAPAGPGGAMPAPGRMLGGRYRLGGVIGTGGSGTVYLADDLSLGRQVAVKVLHSSLVGDEAFVERFRSEARLVASLADPHVVAIYDWGVDGQAYLVTEYLGGGSLRSILSSGRTLTPSQMLMVALEACRALDHAHRQGIVHRDVKPANLLFGQDARLRIADFGLAEALTGTVSRELFGGGGVIGTARYASPEQAQGRPLDGRSDVYALALCMVEGVTGHLPFVADTIADTLAARVGRDVPIPDALGPLVPVVASAGTAEVENRPTAREMGRLLLDVAGRMSRPEPLPLVGPGEVGAAPMPGEAEHGAPSVFVDPGPTTLAHSPVESHSPVQPHAPAAGSQPRRRRRRWRGVLVAVALLVGAVVGGSFLLSAGRTTTRAVPALVNTSGNSARSLLVELGWLVEERYDRRDGSLEGQVLSMQPPGGTRLEAGETVVLVVSLGPARLPVPDDLVGVSVEEAGRRLEAAGLALGTVSSEKDETVATGLVLSVATVDEAVPQGSEVDLVVSGGPLPRVVPKGLVGLMPADVVAELIALRLAPTMGEEHDEWMAAGRVSRIEPVGGTRIQVNDDVRVVVSLGAEPRSVPSLEGLSLVAAESRLAASGFRTVVVEGLTDGEVVDRTLLVVVSQTPPAGRREMPATTVTLVVRPA
ncbi:MAG: protein kinase [Actinomycetota bacterium]|nr:protein kinase [Actinomycetota bacterium]MED6328360.1 protein kinase [Actinomycetota bacterium]MEE2959021.1 protein kinase [Actinomycetota bacterium]